MSVVAYRPVNELEFRLYQDIAQPAVEWADEHLTEEMQEDPPPELRELVRQAQIKMAHFGFMPTPMGLMIRDEPDILEMNVGQLVAEGEQLAQAEIARIMKL